MLKKCLIICLVLFSTLLTACRSPVFNQAETNVAEVKLKAVADRHRFDEQGKASPSLVMRDGLYVDTTPISLSHNPTWLNNHIIIRGDRLPFSYYSRTIASGAGVNVLTKYQVGLDPAVNVSMNYSGTIKGALELLASKAGYVYAIRGGQMIYWQAFVTRTFDIAFMPGGTDYLLGKSSTGSADSAANSANSGAAGTTTAVSNYVSSDYSSGEFSNLKGTLSIWKDLDGTIRQLLSPDGKIMVSEATTSVTVRDRPTNIELIAQYVANLNRNLSKQVLVKIQIIEVNLENDYNFGINWSIVTHAFHNTNFIIRGNYGTPVAIQALTNQATGQSTPQFGPVAANSNVPSYTILLNALNQQGKASIVSEPRVLCLNNQVSVIRVVRSEGYAASIQNTTLAASGATTVATGTVTSQITPGTVVTGLTLYILPKILKDNIYLQVNADVSSNNGFKTFGALNSTSTSNAIQLPDITEKHFNQRSMIRSGDTLILSGFRQISNTANANQFLESQALGGQGSIQFSKETIVLITPIIVYGSA